MDIGGVVAQQFTGPLNELAHTINKLIIVKVEDVGASKPGNPLGGSGPGAAVASAALGATGLGAAASAIQKFTMGGEKFEVQINPEKYQRSYRINYNQPSRRNSCRPRAQYDNTSGEHLNIAFTLDGTGVVPATITDLSNFALQNLTKAIGVTDVSYVTRRLDDLKKIVYDYDSDSHQPPLVDVIWGDVQAFRGKLADMKVDFTLFHPSGVPLRAEVTLDFIEHSTEPSEAHSPDLTHGHIVTQFDTLPLLAEAVYGDASFTWQVAESNQLTYFRRIKTGDILQFPPIERRPKRS